MKKVSHIQLGNLITHFYNTKTPKGKLPMIIYGTFGIGKSFLIESKAKEIAEKKNKIFIGWNEVTRNNKDEVMENPEKYFVLIDIRLSEMDTSDIKGLPDFTKDKNSMEWKIPFFAKLLEKEKSDGILFFDEMGLATPLVISSCYKIIHDRVINESKINNNWLILGATNLECVKGDTLLLGSNKFIKDIKNGDEVMGKKGIVKVKNTIKRKINEEILEIKPRYLLPFEITKNHPLKILKKGKEIWVNARDLKINEFLIIPKLKGNTESKVIKLEKKEMQERKGKLMIKGKGLGISLNKEIAWLLGLFVADGWANKRHVNFGIDSRKEKLKQKIENIIEKNWGFNTHFNKPIKNSYSQTICFGSQILARKLKEICGEGAINKKIPNLILNQKKTSLLKSFLQGYFEGDGHFDEKRKQLSASTISRTLALQLQLSLVRLGIMISLGERKEHKTTIKGKDYICKKSYTFKSTNPKLLHWLGFTKKDIRKPKHLFYINQKDRILIPISKIKLKKYKGFVYNIETSDNTYLINNCISHNCDRAYTHELAPPLKDRMIEMELTPPNIEQWSNWAMENDIDSRIIGYLNWKPSNLHKVDFDDNQKFTTERGWARLNHAIKNIIDYKELDLICGTAIGEGIAKEFVAFCKIKDTIKLSEIIQTPSKLKAVEEISIKYFVVTALAEHYKDKKLTFEKLLEISQVLDEMKNAEFIALLWKLSSKYAKERFRKDFTTKDLGTLRAKFHEYLID